MMCHKTSASIHFPRCFLSILHHSFQQVKKRLMTHGKITDLCWPVIHFCVDIDGIFGIPGRLQLLTPDSLKISRKSSRAAARHKKISSVSIIKSCQPFVFFTFPESFQALICWKSGQTFILFQFQNRTVKHLAVLLHMFCQYSVKILCCVRSQLFFEVAVWILDLLFSVRESSHSVYIKNHPGSILDHQVFSDHLYTSAF